jgi:peptidoglycan-associated lipoprotein
MKQHPAVSLTIEGHCDERGTRDYNLGLGERRAVAVKDYLVSLGIDTRRVTTVSYGKERPAVIGSAETAWSQNRRAVAVVN